MASKGIGLQEARRRLLMACGRCSPPYPDSEAGPTIDSAYSRPRWQVRARDDPGVYCIPRALACRSDLTASDKLAWAALAYRQRDKADCWPSLATIGRDIGCCRDTASEAVKKLEARGLLTVRRSIGQPNHYTTHLPGIPTGTKSQDFAQKRIGPAGNPGSNNHRRCGSGEGFSEPRRQSRRKKKKE